MSKYLTEFKNADDVIEQYHAPQDALKKAKVYLAWYGYGSYCGSSLVIFSKDGKLWEVNGSHCSCYGLEGQWQPEETSWEAIAKRDYSDRYCDGGDEANAELQKIAKRELKRGAKGKDEQ